MISLQVTIRLPTGCHKRTMEFNHKGQRIPNLSSDSRLPDLLECYCKFPVYKGLISLPKSMCRSDTVLSALHVSPFSGRRFLSWVMNEWE